MLYYFPQYISCFVLVPSLFFSFPSMSSSFLACFITLMMWAWHSWVRICLNTLFVLRSTCLGAFYHVYAQIYLFPCFLLCLCLDLHVYLLFAMFVLRCTCLCTFWHVYALMYMSMYFFPCLYLDLHVYVLFVFHVLLAMFVNRSTYWMLCLVLLQPFCLFLCLFLVFWPLGRVQIQILWSRPISMHLGLHQRVWIISFMHVYVCLLLCFTSMFVWLDLGSCHALCPSWACVCWSLGVTCLCGYIHPSYGLFRCNHLREHIPVMLVCLMHTFLHFVQ